jgi:hypothetical protein
LKIKKPGGKVRLTVELTTLTPSISRFNQILIIYIGCTGHAQALGEVSEQNFFIMYIGHVEAVGEVSRPTFLIMYIGDTGHLEAVAEFWGPTFFLIYIGCTGHVRL